MATIRKNILKWVKEVEDFRKKNTECRDLLQKIKNLENQKTVIHSKLHNEEYQNQEEFHELNFKISQIAQEKREADKAYEDMMGNKFAEFKKTYQSIYEMAINQDGIDKNTLNHVLNVFTQLKENKISYNQGTNLGLKYIENKFDLPEDFFNYLPE